jgi:3-oxoacyl-[acyl-carrier-protein] synthase II
MSAMRLPVAILGYAWRTPLGPGIDGAMARLWAGERACAPNPRLGAESYACRLAAAIASPPAASRDARFLRRMGLFGMEVAREAFAASGCAGGPRVGLFSGVGGLRAHWDDMMAALAGQRDDGRGAWDLGLRDVHPYWMLKHLSNNVHALAAAELGLVGDGATFGGGNAGAQALAAAARALWDGAIDAALVVAHDSLLEPETLVELGARRAATHATDAAQVAPPYDARAAGFVPGEAAAAIMIARPDAAAGRATVEAVDTADGEPAEPRAETVGRVVSLIAGDGAGAVDGASRAWPELDAAEREALAAHVAADTPLTSIAAATGRVGAATSIVQAIALCEALRRGVLPPIAGLDRAPAGPCVPLACATPTTATSAIAVATAAPGLAAAIRVEVAP